MTSSMIQIEGLVKRYGTTEALKGLSFDVPRGQVVGFLGPNGAGKSTTMRILAGSLKPTAGKAKVAGIDVVEDPVEARRRIGYLPENNPLYEDMMVAEYLRYVADVRGLSPAERKPRLTRAVEACGLTTVLGKDIGQLSRGFRQRVGLAQAILHEPDLLILDEPTAGLDPNQIVEIRHLIRELGREKTVILSTHILPEVQSTCSRVLIITDGKLVADDTPEHLTAAAEGGGVLHVVLAARHGQLLELSKVKGLLAGMPGVTGVDEAESDGPGTLGFRVRFSGDDVRRTLFEVCVQNDLALLEVRRTQVSLEDTFRKLTTDARRAA
ncbi:MAG: ATP-binding cassette domain-containing protein [Myxococcota bacterium]